MQDPVYDSGVLTASLIETLDSISRALQGRGNYAIVPLPIQGVAPFTHIDFVEDSGVCPKDLVYRSRHSPTSSRRFNAYNSYRGGPASLPPYSDDTSIVTMPMKDLIRDIDSVYKEESEDEIAAESSEQKVAEPIVKMHAPRPPRRSIKRASANV